MKRAQILSLFTLAALLAMGITGCKKPEKGITNIHGRAAATPKGPGPGGMVDTGKSGGTDTGITIGNIATPLDLETIMNMIADRETFKNETVYFDFDRSTVKAGERGKIETVAGYLKGNRDAKLQIEGHCDERGTPEYNRSLGERRALSLREYLVRLGVDADRVFTISYGEDRPAEVGNDESAWAKNRRGVFVLLKPKT